VEALSAISGQEVRWTLGIVFAGFGEEAGRDEASPCPGASGRIG